ncbi:MAG: hypothetical protein RL017_917, partial [Pseudomonadota bacterium]
IYVVGYFKFCLKLYILFPVVILYLLRIINNEKAKQISIKCLFKNYSFAYLDVKAKKFANECLNKYIRPQIYSKLEYHLEHGHTVILVSANLAIYLRHWAQLQNIDDVIATEVTFANNICTGDLLTRNCYGKQKIYRINQYLKNKNCKFLYSFGYGNSRGDYELLIYVNEGYWVNNSGIIPWNDYRESIISKHK